MYLVNTSFAVEPSVVNRWLDIMTGSYIPMLADKGYTVVAFSRVISIDAVDNFTYSLLVEADDMGQYRELTEELFGEYLDVACPLFGEKVLWFTTLMKKI